MEGTVTISIKDFEYLRRCEERIDWIERAVNSILDEYGEMKPSDASKIIDKVMEKMFI